MTSDDQDLDSEMEVDSENHDEVELSGIEPINNYRNRVLSAWGLLSEGRTN